MARSGALLRGRAEAGPGRSATPRPIRPTTSAAPTPRRRWRSSRGSPSAPRSASTRSPTRGSRRISPDDLAYAKELGLSLKLLGVAERVGDDEISVRVFPCFLYPGHPLAPDRGRRSTRSWSRRPTITEITMSGPGAGGPETASAVLGDVVSVICGGSPLFEENAKLRVAKDVQSAFYLHLEVEDRPACWPRSPRSSATTRSRCAASSSAGMGDDARLVMVMHQVPREELRRRPGEDRQAQVPALAARARSG